jgi:uncharacterized membrane protein YozB (DUF420 family)
MLVVLGIMVIGIGFGFLTKTKENLLQHRWTLSAAIVLALGAIFLVMLPAAFRFYVDPDVEFFSSLSYTAMIHGIIGVPAVTTAVIFAFGELPKNVKKWMRITALLWITDIAFGIVLFLQMMELV